MEVCLVLEAKKDVKEEEREGEDGCLRVKKMRRNMWSRKMWRYFWS